NDASLPLESMFDIFSRAPKPKRMLILRRADHMHFLDHADEMHELVRTMAWPGLAEIQKRMLPISELISGDLAHLFVRGLTLAHFDAALQHKSGAQRFLSGDLAKELASRGVDMVEHEPRAHANSRPTTNLQL